MNETIRRRGKEGEEDEAEDEDDEPRDKEGDMKDDATYESDEMLVSLCGSYG